MQQTVSNKVQLRDTLNPMKNYGRVPAIDDEANLVTLCGKIDKIGKFWKTGRGDESLSSKFNSSK